MRLVVTSYFVRHRAGRIRVIKQQQRSYLEELQPGEEVGHVAPQRLERRVRLGGPHGGHFAHQHAVEDVLQLGRHDDLALQGFADVHQADAHDTGESVGKGRRM